MHWIAAIIIVVMAAGLGALIAGDPTTAPYAALAKPAWTPPLPAWFFVAAAYYVAMTVALARLLRRRDHRHAIGALALLVLVLLANEVWNVFLFRMGRADFAFYSLFPFAALVLAAAWMSMRVDRVSGAILFIYSAWLLFDLAWTHQLAGMN